MMASLNFYFRSCIALGLKVQDDQTTESLRARFNEWQSHWGDAVAKITNDFSPCHENKTFLCAGVKTDIAWDPSQGQYIASYYIDY